jgi:septum formation protein
MASKAVFHTLRPLLLASGSPRRRAFLQELGLDFQVETTAVDESGLPGEAAETLVRRLAAEKAWDVARRHADHVVLGADTVVVRDGHLLGKPRNRRDAEAMLASLAGRWHEVWTGFALCGRQPHLERVGAVVTRVRFAEVSPLLIAAYAASGDGDDKAGGYGIQSSGAFLVAEIAGSYTNVVGLPMAEVVAALLELGVVGAAAAVTTGNDAEKKKPF